MKFLSCHPAFYSGCLNKNAALCYGNLGSPFEEIYC